MSQHDAGGAYSPPPDDYETFDARDVEQDRRGWLFLGASAVVFVLFVAVVYNTFQLGVRERGDSPIIAPDAEPYRVAPEDPGGYQVPDQDLSVTNLRESGAAQDGDTEAASNDSAALVRDVSEEPVDPPQRDLPALQIETTDADALDEPGETQAEVPAPQSQPADPEPQPTTPEPEPAPAETAPAASQPSLDDLITTRSSGQFVAQIAAYRSAADAEAGWINFVSRFPDLAVGRGPDIQRADLGERGVFHRLRIAAFETRAEAAAYCETLSDRGQACLVATR
jgi:cell division protein FtsN